MYKGLILLLLALIFFSVNGCHFVVQVLTLGVLSCVLLDQEYPSQQAVQLANSLSGLGQIYNDGNNSKEFSVRIFPPFVQTI